MRMTFAVLAALTLTLGQTAAANQTSNRSYAGTWTAELAGTTFVRLELADTGGTLRGAMSLGDIELDKAGIVIKAKTVPRELKPLLDVVLRDSHLSFARRDDTDIDRFELRLTGADAADLLFVLSDDDRKEVESEGLPIPKPIRLKRIALRPAASSPFNVF
jgi:hypothetical protein